MTEAATPKRRGWLSGVLLFVVGAAASTIIGMVVQKSAEPVVDHVASLFQELTKGDLSDLSVDSGRAPNHAMLDAFSIQDAVTERNPNAAEDSQTFPDVTFFVCDGTQYTGLIERLTVELLAGRYGSLKNAVIQPTDAARVIFQDRVTVVYDAAHDERKVALDLVDLHFDLATGVPVQVLPNTGKTTPWRVSVFYC